MKWAFVPSRFLANPVADFLTLFTSMFMHAGAPPGSLRSDRRCAWLLYFDVPATAGQSVGSRLVTPASALIVIGGWLVLQFFSGIGSIATADRGGVAYMAQIGGFIAGFVLTFLFRGNVAPRLTS